MDDGWFTFRGEKFGGRNQSGVNDSTSIYEMDVEVADWLTCHLESGLVGLLALWLLCGQWPDLRPLLSLVLTGRDRG